MVDVTILGAGVCGLTIATEIVARGGSVRLHDPAGGPGAHGCSWWAGGMLAPYCERESAEEPVVRLGAEAADWWDRHAGGVTRNGSLVVALGRDKGELKRFARRTEGFAELNGAEVAALEPDLTDRTAGALYFESEAHLSPRDAVVSLRNGLAAKGVDISTEAPSPSAQNIDCRGLAARDALTDLRGVKGEMLILRCPDVTLTRPVRLLHPRFPLYIVPRGDGVYMLGATMIEASERTRVTARSMMELLNAAYALHPAFGEAEVLEIGVDARPAFPNNLPRIRRREDTIYANGLFRHGYLLAPSVARMTADYLFDGLRPEVMDED
ncbi:MAG: FAD-dependent oxidoreductase [Paracoccaceae bacterium]|nr:FAD-dependent oxidoreductase [Paracoccaceae bacterium]